MDIFVKILPEEVTMSSAPTYIKYAAKYKLKNSVQYLYNLKSPLDESILFWNPREGSIEGLFQN